MVDKTISICGKWSFMLEARSSLGRWVLRSPQPQQRSARHDHDCPNEVAVLLPMLQVRIKHWKWDHHTVSKQGCSISLPQSSERNHPFCQCTVIQVHRVNLKPVMPLLWFVLSSSYSSAPIEAYVSTSAFNIALLTFQWSSTTGFPLLCGLCTLNFCTWRLKICLLLSWD